MIDFFADKLRDPRIKSFPAEIEKIKGRGFYHNGNEFVHHANLHQNETAFLRLVWKQKIVLISILLVLYLSLIVDWQATIIFLIALLIALYVINLFFDLFLIYCSYAKASEIQISDAEIKKVRESDWPSYTIFCPLYKESNVVPQFIQAMNGLDYPQKKLQILIILEEDDTQTQKDIAQLQLPSNFQVVIVPQSLPKTKPKALNYALRFATGTYVVIYDAEDIPEPQQLKKTVIAFEKSDEKVVCIQAKLNFYNPRHNTLTRVFTAEYSLWFDLVLTGLQAINAPIPLGGTSNHFRKVELHALRGWDSFNVTEDCDLGMRLVKQGYKTAIINSTTHEEANSDLRNWFGQRSRWIKGYIQTYLVHMRRPQEFMRTWKDPHLLTFQLVVGGKVLCMFVNPMLWIITISYFAFRPFLGEKIESFFPTAILYPAVFCTVVGNFLYFYYYMIGCAKRGYYDVIKYGLFVPLYWLMMSVATWKAVIDVFIRPHHWFKTKHGLHLDDHPKLAQKLMLPKNIVPSIKYAEI